jgi:TPP-dependent 2-oxoacid decarboxylase
MQCSYPSVDTGNAQSMYLPAGIALEKPFELAGIEILALTCEFDLQLLDEVFHTKRIRWLGNVDQLKA